MNDLYTFNSQQMHSITHEQQLPQKHTLFRKKILCQREAKKLPINQGFITEEEPIIGQRRVSRSPFKKVTFNQPNPSLCWEESSCLSPMPNSTSLNQQNLEALANQFPELPPLSKRYPQKSMEESRIIQRPVLRSFSAVKRPETDRIKADQCLNIKKDPPICRQRRILSLRMSPKIVLPLSNRKLPKAFRINLQDKGPRSVNSQCRNRKQNCKMTNLISKSPHLLDQKFQGRQRFEKLLIIQNKFFQKLYMPTGY